MKGFKRLLAVALAAVMALTMLTACSISTSEITTSLNEKLEKAGIAVTVEHDEKLDKLLNTTYNKYSNLVKLTDIDGSKKNIEEKFTADELKNIAQTELGETTDREYKVVYGTAKNASAVADLIKEEYEGLTTEEAQKYTRYGIKKFDFVVTNFVVVVLSTAPAE